MIGTGAVGEREVFSAVEQTAQRSHLTTLIGDDIFSPHNADILSQVIDAYMTVYGEDWSEGWRCNKEGHSVHISRSEHQKRLLSSPHGAVHCDTQDCDGIFVPYYDPAELQERMRTDLCADEQSFPVLATWQEDGLVTSFALTLVTGQRTRMTELLLNQPYFAHTQLDPEQDLAEFWQNLALRNPERFLYAHEIVTLPAYRGRTQVFAVSAAVGKVATEQGCLDTVGVAAEGTGFIRLLQATKPPAATVVHQTKPKPGNPSLLFFHIPHTPEISQAFSHAATQSEGAAAFITLRNTYTALANQPEV
jgi:hypothetical protein